MKDATQYDLLKGLYVTVVPVYDELGKQASNGSLMLYDDTPGRILENQAPGLATHTTAFISVYEEHKIHLFFTGRNHAGNNADAILSNRTTQEPVIGVILVVDMISLRLFDTLLITAGTLTGKN